MSDLGGSSPLVTILSLTITLIVGLSAPILVYIASKQARKQEDQGKALERIEIHVDGRLTEAIDEVKKLQKLVATSRESGKSVPKANSK